MEHRSVDLTEGSVWAALSGIPLGGLRFLERVESTNDVALEWAAEGAPDLSVVVADEQTHGRGRSGRRWVTKGGTALAVSVVLRSESQPAMAGRLSGLGAVAAAEACEALGADAQIKWPNDVLIQRQKVAGILLEAEWKGDRMGVAVLGIGLNVRRGSAPPASAVDYPATSLEESLGVAPSRTAVLRWVVEALITWRPRLETAEFLESWGSRLAFRREQVIVTAPGSAPITGELIGLAEDGSLRVSSAGNEARVYMGEAHLLPANVRMT